MKPETLTDKLAAAEAQVASLTAEKVTLNDKLAAARTAVTAGEGLQAKLTAAEAQVTQLTTDKAALTEKLTSANAKIVALTGDVSKQTERADLAEKKLRLDPSIKHLFKDGVATAPAGGDAGAGGSEATPSLNDQYQELRKKDPAAATTFWKQNEKAIKEEQKKQAEAKK